MRVLVIHQNFPGQFAHLVRTWSQRAGWDVRGLGRDTAPGLPGFNALMRYKPTCARWKTPRCTAKPLRAPCSHCVNQALCPM